MNGRAWVHLLMACSLLAFWGTDDALSETRQITIVYSADERGEINPCG